MSTVSHDLNWVALVALAALLLPLSAEAGRRAVSDQEVFLNILDMDKRLEKMVGQRVTLHGWIAADAKPTRVSFVEERSHDVIAIEPLRVPRDGRATLTFTWTGVENVRAQYSSGIKPNGAELQRRNGQIARLETTFHLDSKPRVYATATGTLCRLKILQNGIENHRRCQMPWSHFFFSVDDVKLAEVR